MDSETREKILGMLTKSIGRTHYVIAHALNVPPWRASIWLSELERQGAVATYGNGRDYCEWRLT